MDIRPTGETPPAPNHSPPQPPASDDRPKVVRGLFTSTGYTPKDPKKKICHPKQGTPSKPGESGEDQPLPMRLAIQIFEEDDKFNCEKRG